MSGLAPIIIPVLVTIATAVILAALRFAVNRIKANIEAQQQLKEDKDAQRAKAQWDLLKAIETQTKLTNGRVTEVESQLQSVKERMAHVEGEYESVMRMIPRTGP